mmetsp:Transcript_6435/g.16025  ORF Transcript_6435/g.16025 Transcript_6435/m.16025 type:complete len:83 (-) Transcript_6435:33-281(-)
MPRLWSAKGLLQSHEARGEPWKHKTGSKDHAKGVRKSCRIPKRRVPHTAARHKQVEATSQARLTSADARKMAVKHATAKFCN